jgi:hypothetical protein
LSRYRPDGHDTGAGDALPSRHDGDKIELDLVRIAVLRQSQALRKAHDMGIDTDGLLGKGVAEYDVGGFSADAGKTDQIIQTVRHFSAETLDDLHATIANRARFVAVKVDPADLLFELLLGRSRVIHRGAVFLKEFDRDLIDEIVPGLRR